MLSLKKTVAWGQALVLLALTGCASPRWQVFQSEYSYRADSEESHYFTQNSILVDTKTGRTWILSHTAEDDPAGYEWIPMMKNGASPEARKKNHPIRMTRTREVARSH